MFKPLSFHELKEIRRFTLNDFNRWFRDVYEAGLNAGAAYGALWRDDEIYMLLRSERIGEERAWRIVEKLLEREETNVHQ